MQISLQHSILAAFSLTFAPMSVAAPQSSAALANQAARGSLPGAQPELLVLDTSAGAPWSAKGPADVSDAGRVVGQVVVNGSTASYEWTAAGGLSLIQTNYAGVGRINSNGEMIYPLNPLVLTDSTEIYIQNLFGTPTVQLNDVNDNLTVVGSAPGSGTTSKVLVWDPVNGSRSFYFPSAERLVRVNQGSLAVGVAKVQTTGSDGFLLDLNTGTTRSFNATLPQGPTTWSIAVDVNDHGVVVGEGSDGSGLSAFTWSAVAGFTFLPGLHGGETKRVHPTAVDNSGRVVGMAMNSARTWRAFLWDPQLGMQDLNDLVSAPAGYTLIEATDISETGVAIGRGTFNGASVPQRGFVLSGL